MIIGICISISSNQWLILWVGLELNIFSFLPILGASKNKKEILTAPLYLRIQAVASGLIIIRIVISMVQSNYWSDIILQLAILTKAGGPPAFCWYPNIVNNLSWRNAWILITLQKVTPILILSLATKLSSVTILLAARAAIIGGIGGIIQSQLRGVLAYSSLTHLGWTISVSPSSPLISLNYFIVYIIILSAIITILLSSNLKSHPNISNISNQTKKTISLLLISLAGLPPIIGFLPKLQAIEAITTSASPIIISFLLLGSVINLYFYLNLIFSTSASNIPTHILKIPNYYNSSIILTLASLPLFILIPSIWQRYAF